MHPKDRTTSVLSALYEGKDANVISSNCSNKKMEHLLHHVSTQERIMLLGHGSDKGNHPKYADLLIAKKLASVYSRVFL